MRGRSAPCHSAGVPPQDADHSSPCRDQSQAELQFSRFRSTSGTGWAWRCTGAARGARKLASVPVSARHSSADAAAADGARLRFVEDRPGDIHEERPKPWHRYAYHVRTLPLAIALLAGELRAGSGSRVLDYGCGVVAYRHFFPADVRYAAADLPGNPHANLLLHGDGTVPAEDGGFDAVMSTQVLEHVPDPALYLAECFRVLRPGRRMLLSTHGTFVYHPDPDDYWRWTCAALQKAVRDAGF